MTVNIVLAMHGAPPLDFPKEELTEFFKLHVQMETIPEHVRKTLRPRYEELEKRIRTWPRTSENDPFFAGASEMARKLSAISGFEVMVGFNEFCSPTLKESIVRSGESKPEKIIVITPMMTRGGEHAQMDIPKAIEDVRSRLSDIPIVYAWPFDEDDIARFLLAQIEKYK
jgi:sirohydrochlorin cobaltochelatase